MKTIEAAPVYEGYNEVNGTYYRADMPAAIVKVLETARANGRPIRIYYGDVVTGLDWNEEHDVKGTVGRSMGPCKVPLLVGKGQAGGGEIRGSIVRIRYADSDRDLYRHPNYHSGKIEVVEDASVSGYTHAILIGGQLYSRHKTQKSAHMLAAKLL